MVRVASAPVRWVLLGLFIGIGLASSALAQDEAADEPAEVDSVGPQRDAPSTVDEITVTGAQNSVTDVQAESAAITAFSMEELDRSNIVNIDSLAFNVPGLHVGQQGADSIVTLRGISTENASPTGEAGAQFIVDGVNYARPSSARVAFFDLEGLQVKRGPQGTRGGKNATAGWIEVTTRKPTADFEVTADYQVGAYGQRKTRASLNIPINEYLQSRFALYTDDRQGFQRNLFTNDEDRDAFDADDLGFRGHLRLLPTDSLDLLMTYNYYESKGVGPHVEIVPVPTSRQCTPFAPPFFNPLTNFPSIFGCGARPDRTINGEPAPIFAATGFDRERRPQFLNFERPETAGVPRDVATGAVVQPHRVFLDNAAQQENIFWGWSATLNWDVPTLPFFGDSQLKLIPAFQRTHPDGSSDPDGTDLTFLTGDVERKTDQWSGEVQWVGATLDEEIEWHSSLFYLREQTDSHSEFTILFDTTQNLIIDQLTENKSYGASLSTTWHALENFSVRLGGRYIKDVKRNRLLRDSPPISVSSGNAALGICNGAAEDIDLNGLPDGGLPTCKQQFRQVIGDVTLDWWPQEEKHLYLTIGNGFKGGGFALGESGARNAGATTLSTYEPEKIWAFMLGSKNSFFDDRLTLNLEAFYYNYRDQQLVLVDGFSVRTDNAQDTLMQGVDLEFDAEPFAGLRFDGNVSVMDTEFKKYSAVDPLQVSTSSNCRIEANSLDPNFVAVSPGCIPEDFSGNEVTRSPKLSYTLGAEYDVYLGRFGTLTPRVQFYFQDETWFRPQNKTFATTGANTPCPAVNPRNGCTRGTPSRLLGASQGNDLQEQYHYTDLKLTWRSPAEKWTLEAFVQNLEDVVVFQNVIVASAILDSPQMAWYGHPRLWGLRAQFRY